MAPPRRTRGAPYASLVALLTAAPCKAYQGAGLVLPSFLRQRLPTVLGGAPWYGKGGRNGLHFDCTGCGRCCKMDGDVWLAPEEVVTISDHLGVSQAAFEKLYTRASVVGRGDEGRWFAIVRPPQVGSGGPLEALVSPAAPPTQAADSTNGLAPSKPQADLESQSESGCVFLDPTGQCSIYDVRPVQCRTYPFWPSLVGDQASWECEGVLPDDTPLPPARTATAENPSAEDEEENKGPWRRHWSLAEGGCEGIRRPPAAGAGDGVTGAVIVPEDVVTKNCREARDHWRRFPEREIKESTWYL